MLQELGSSEARQKISDYLWSRVDDKKEKNILGFGFGVGLKDWAIDIERPFCIRAYVKRKKKKGDRWRVKWNFKDEISIPMELIPDGIDSIGRKVKGMMLTMPTDVTEVGDLEGTAQEVQLDGDPSIVTSGTVIRWKVSGEHSHRWGILTVTHGFDDPVERTAVEDITIHNPTTGRSFRGRRRDELRATDLDSAIDLTLIEVEKQILVNSGLIKANGNTSIAVRRYSKLTGDGGQAGTVFQANGRTFGFHIVGTLSLATFNNVGTVVSLLHVIGPPQTFVKGTSGSPFAVIDNPTGALEPAGIQIGADFCPKLEFSHGYAQSLDVSLGNLTLKMNRRLLRTGRSLETNLEVIRLF